MQVYQNTLGQFTYKKWYEMLLYFKYTINL
jgi:hypothetical protein